VNNLIAFESHHAPKRADNQPFRAIPLSPREINCVELAGDGLSNAQIGRVLGIALDTVRANLRTATIKLGVVGSGRLALYGAYRRMASRAAADLEKAA
jgi:DNA-binding CsgD family transcriptional regulator